MNREDADKIRVGDCLRRCTKRGFTVIRVTAINKEWYTWKVQVIDCLDERLWARDDVSFDYVYTNGFYRVDCERDFLRLHMILKMQQVAIRPLLESIKNANLAQIENVQNDEA